MRTPNCDFSTGRDVTDGYMDHNPMPDADTVGFDHLLSVRLLFKDGYILISWSSPAEANMKASTGFHETTLQDAVCPSMVSISVPCSRFQTYIRESKVRTIRSNWWKTFASTENKVLLRTAETRPDHKLFLSLTDKFPDQLKLFNIPKMDLLGHGVDQDIFGIVASNDRGHVMWHLITE